MQTGTPDARLGVMLRLLLGSLFIAHLYWKVAVLPGGIETWWMNLVHAGYPPLVPAYVLSAEVAGALLLIPGVLTRYVALYAAPMMFGAAQFWLVRKGFYFTARAGNCRWYGWRCWSSRRWRGTAPWRLYARPRRAMCSQGSRAGPSRTPARLPRSASFAGRSQRAPGADGASGPRSDTAFISAGVSASMSAAASDDIAGHRRVPTRDTATSPIRLLLTAAQSAANIASSGAATSSTRRSIALAAAMT